MEADGDTALNGKNHWWITEIFLGRKSASGKCAGIRTVERAGVDYFVCEFLGRATFESNSIRFDRQVQATFHPCRYKVKSVSLNHRFMIAWRSPDGVVQSALLLCPSERKVTNLRLVLRRSLSPVRFERNGLQNCGHFSQFSKRGRRIFLQPRLCGG